MITATRTNNRVIYQALSPARRLSTNTLSFWYRRRPHSGLQRSRQTVSSLRDRHRQGVACVSSDELGAAYPDGTVQSSSGCSGAGRGKHHRSVDAHWRTSRHPHEPVERRADCLAPGRHDARVCQLVRARDRVVEHSFWKERILRSGQGWQFYLAFAPRGDLLAARGLDGVTRLWDLATEQVILNTSRLRPLSMACGFPWRSACIRTLPMMRLSFTTSSTSARQ
jgi:hypothetical protein